MTVLICSIVIFLSYYGVSRFIINKPFVISTVTMGKGDSMSMINGIKYYLNKINRQGGIRGKPVVLKEYKDYGNPQLAKEIATQISQDNETLIVLGHYLSSCSQAAGRIYQLNGIPAITGSATSDDLTTENPYYFRVLPPNQFQGKFLAYYIKINLNKKSVSIIYEKSAYGTTFYYSFIETAKNIGLKVNYTYGISIANNQDLNFVNNSFNNITDKTIVICAHSDVGSKLLTYLNFPGSERTIIGSDSFSTNAFINALHAIPKEQSIPGYFSDNLYTVMPFLKEFGSLDTFFFVEDYKNKYKKEPNWVAFTYHDAALTAVNAIHRTEMKNKSIRKIRSSIRNELAGMYSYKQSVKGLTGSIFFDKKGNTINSIGMGYYKKSNLYPAYSQYKFLPNIKMSKNTFREAMKGKIIAINDMLLKRTSIIYTGVKLQKIHNIDINNETYEIEFLIWFRSKGDINVSDIVFEDAITPINLGDPVIQKLEGDINYTVFRAKGTFGNSFILYNFPFDTHILQLRYHHVFIPNYTLVYVPDKFELNKHKTNNNQTYKNWKIYHTSFFQDLHRFEVSPEKYVDYSQFNMNWYVKRIGHGIIYRCILPLCFFFIISLIIVCIPNQRIGLRLFLIITIICTEAASYSFLQELIFKPYLTLFDLLYFILVGYQILCVFMSILIYFKNNNKILLMTEKIILPLTIGFITFLVIHQGSYVFFSKALSNDQLIENKTNDHKGNSNDQVFIVNENAKINTFVGKLHAQKQTQQKITYDIMSGNEKMIFGINPDTGEIHVKNNKYLDYEMHKVFNLKVAIIHKSSVMQVINVIIHVKNTNEAPIMNPKTISIEENIPEFSVITPDLEAFDPDIEAINSDNDSLSYTIVSGNHDNTFTIHPSNGKISMNISPDYERISSYTLVVKAYDTLGLCSVQSVNILVNNVNEAPVFKPKEISIYENIPESSVVFPELEAIDPDNDPVSYTIVSGNSGNTFKIQPSTGMISINKSPDYENISSYTLSVKAYDREGLYSIQPVNIFIENENEAPEFTSKTISIHENMPELSVIVPELEAVDPDNDLISYTIVGGNKDNFQIQPVSGQISIVNPPNFEHVSSYTLVVKVSDSHGLTAVQPVYISVKNINEAPVFESKTVSIKENIPESTVVIAGLGAIDPENDPVSYCIVSGNKNQTFHIKPETGMISVNKTPDYEDINLYTLIVKVSDSHGLAFQESVTINIENVNEAAVFQSRTFTIKENIPELSVIVAKLEALDPDNDPVSYETVGGNIENTFKIQADTGQISINKSPDYEHISSYTLVVKASDHLGLGSIQPVYIFIQDVNEKPEIKDQIFYYNKAECIVGTLTAHDPENKPLAFRIENQSPGATGFYIEDTTLKVSDNFIFQKNTYVLLVEVTDNKGLTTSANIKVVLIQ